jgi:hypothetical protein
LFSLAIKKVQVKSMNKKQGGWNVKTLGGDRSFPLNRMGLIYLPKIGGEWSSHPKTYHALYAQYFASQL